AHLGRLSMNRSICAALAAAAAACAAWSAPAPAQGNATPNYAELKPHLDGTIPRTVPPFPFAAFPIDTRPMFDTFAWQNFIAVMWPSAAGEPGPYRPGDPAAFGKYDRDLQP